jgi:hypothetical protein
MSRILVVLTEPVDPVVMRELDRQLAAEDEVRVVASESLSPLKWLTNDEDQAREQAEAVAERGAEIAGDHVEAAPTAGDPDPVQATADALRTFAASEIIVIAPASAELETADFEALGAPVRFLRTAAKPAVSA